MLAVILPLTSRGVARPLESIARFASCLPLESRVFAGVDEDDEVWASEEGQESLRQVFGCISVTIQLFPSSSPEPAPICAIARDLGRLAFQDGCAYFALLGDDIQILPKRTWMLDIVKEFEAMGDVLGIEPGFGCVALNDVSFKVRFAVLPCLPSVTDLQSRDAGIPHLSYRASYAHGDFWRRTVS